MKENKDKKMLVTVIVPVYQVEQYLDRCIQSIQNQTYKNIEIFLIDDGSRDKSGMICDEYARKDPRIQVFHKTNGGLSDARNYGIERANGDYLVFVDSDDYISKDFIETMLESAIRNQSELVMCRFAQVTGEEFSDCQKIQERIVSVEEAFWHICNNSKQHILYTVAWNKLYKRKLFESVRYPIGRIHEDEGTTYKILAQVETVVVIDKEMYGYYMSPNSIMRSRYNKRRLDILYFQVEKIHFLKENNQIGLEMSARRQFGETLIYHYYCTRKFLKHSESILEKLLYGFEEECFKSKECFPKWVKLNFSFFYYCTNLYYYLFSLYRKIRD